jgi:hypothetical protein
MERSGCKAEAVGKRGNATEKRAHKKKGAAFFNT